MANIALVIHGGAGTILRSRMTPALEAEYRGGLETALKLGFEVLEAGGRSLDAVEAAVRSLEDFPLFNAGRGSVFTHEGEVELDAAVMDGHTQSAGAVAFVKNIKNPISLARLVMERTEHILLAGEGANHFAEQMEVETAPDEYFFTEHRWLQLQEAMAEGRVQLDHNDTIPTAAVQEEADSKIGNLRSGVPANPLGTVGAVACDIKGNLAAATSTGGMTNKKFGRVGDSPIIGAGLYADSNCAVSSTGHGEFFMRTLAAYDVAARMRYLDCDLETAARGAIDSLTALGGEGGVIAVDSKGNIALPFNSEGMYRGYVSADTGIVTGIYS